MMVRTTFTKRLRVGRVTALALLFLVAICLATLAFTASARASGPAPTYLTIRAEGVDLSGKVKSPRLRCVGNRKIRLYKQLGTEQKPSSDLLVATDISERHGDYGVWSTGNTGISGKFYVRTSKVLGCRAGASKTIRASR
ncbi:MAG: hypothetical protein ACR2GU_07025 [Rubrobacteraceae bacterium]|jgi:hypothetical protein